MAVRMPSGLNRLAAALMLVIGLMYFGAFEFLREGGRRPYIIYDYMYSNAILQKDLDQVAESGILHRARWIEHRRVTSQNVLGAGKELFNVLCLSCHSIGGPLNDMRRLLHRSSPEELNLIFSTMGRERPYMPPFAGNEFEKQVLIYFLNTDVRQ